MIKKITLKLLLITLITPLLMGQQKGSGIYVDTSGQVFVKANMPAYFFITPDKNQELRIPITSKDPNSNPMYFDGNGVHFIRAIDAGTNKPVSFKIMADGIAPIVNLSFNNVLLKNSHNRFYVEVGSKADIIVEDNLSGVQDVFASIDNSEFINAKTVIFDKERDYMIRTYAIDNVGNISDTLNFNVITALDSIVKIKNIYFDTNSSRLRSESKVELDEFIQVLKEYPELRIELRAHTDSRGDATYNLNLSESRAEAIVNYMIYKGISKNRLTFKGYGDTIPVNECTKGTTCSDEKHQVNRRVEFKILPIK